MHMARISQNRIALFSLWSLKKQKKVNIWGREKIIRFDLKEKVFKKQ